MGLVDTLFLEEAEPDSSRSEHPELCDDRGLEAEAIPFLMHLACCSPQSRNLSIKVFKQGFGGAGL